MFKRITAVMMMLAPGLLSTTAMAQTRTPPAPAVGPTSDAQRLALDVRDPFGMTPLHWAVVSGRVDIVRLLLARGADPNLKDDHGMTPLHLAAQLSEAAAVQALVNGGARTDIRDEDDMIPLQWAQIRSDAAVVRILIGAR